MFAMKPVTVVCDESSSRSLEPVHLLQALQRAGLAQQYVLYANLENPSAEVRLACDPLVQIGISRSHITASCAELAWEREQPAHDPLAELPVMLRSLPLPEWTAYGYFGFDLARYYFDYPHSIEQPLLQLIIPKREFIFDENGLRFRTYCEDAAQLSKIVSSCSREPAPAELTLQPPELPAADPKPYLASVEALLQAIRRGELLKAILARSLRAKGQLDAPAVFARGMQRNPASRAYAFTLGDVRGVGFSPEIFLSASGDETVITNPLAGTRPRGQTDAEDQRLREELFSNAKEVKEHALSIWLCQEELRRVCAPTSLRIYDFMEVKRFRFVQHLSSRVSGKLLPGKTTWDAIKELFPGITVSGIAKSQALRQIGRLEETPRGVYGGAIGWIASDGSADLGIAIRAIFEYQGNLVFNAGAGIVAESLAEHEYTESLNKMRTMLSLIA